MENQWKRLTNTHNEEPLGFHSGGRPATNISPSTAPPVCAPAVRTSNLLIYVSAIVLVKMWDGPVVLWFLTPVLLVAIGRGQRGLEALTHETTHFNIVGRRSRSEKVINDIVGAVLFAAPSFCTVAAVRASHTAHHSLFGTDKDPDLQRYRNDDLESLDRDTLFRYMTGVVRRLPGYVVGWWRAIGTDLAAVASGVLWHTLVFVILFFFLGFATAVAVTAVVLSSNVVVLTIIRFVGEAAEHQYSGTGTVIAATYTNDGWAHRLVFHPHADGIHTVHHLWPGIPHHALRKVHKALMEHDPNYRDRVRIRTAVAGERAQAQAQTS